MKKEQKVSFKGIIQSIFFIGVIFVGFFVSILITTNTDKSAFQQEQPTEKPVPTIAPKVKGAVSKKTSPPINTNPVITCNIHANCGGGSQRITQSECNNLTCCNLNDGTSKLMTKYQCDNYYSNNKTNTPTPSSPQNQNSTTPTTQLNFYCYDNTYNYWYYTSSGEQCNLDNANSILADICTNNVKSFGEYKDCQNQCMSTSAQDTDICLAAYSGSNALIEDNWDLYKECSNEATDIYIACLDSCNPLYSKVYNECVGK